MKTEYEFLSRLDNDQIKVCTHIGNAVISAGAGSGKTEVFGKRFAWLVMREENPIRADRILTLTFTKKAAAEMYSRIYSTLKELSDDANTSVTEVQRQRAKDGLKVFSKAHIQTLDSYCGDLVKKYSNVLGLPKDFSTGSAESKNNISGKALPFLFRHKDDDWVKYLIKPGQFEAFANQKITGILTDTVSLKDDGIKNLLTGKLDAQCSHIIDLLNKNIRNANAYYTELNKAREEAKQIYEQHAAEIIRAVPEYEAYYNDILLPTFTLFDEYQQDAIQKRNLDVLNREYEKTTEWAVKVTEIKLCKIPAKKNPYSKELMDALENLKSLCPNKTCAKRCNPFNGELFGIPKFKINFINQYYEDFPYIKSFYEAMETDLIPLVFEEKRKSGALTFKDVTDLALKLLKEDPEISRAESECFDKIMIDEFQDNNGDNRDLLLLLCNVPAEYLECADPENRETQIRKVAGFLKENAPDKLFFVGDEKQSIYRFRNADVSVFNELRTKYFKQTDSSDTSMSYNYRSEPPVAGAFNLIFGSFDKDKNFLGKNPVFPNITNKSFEAAFPETAFVKKNPKDPRVDGWVKKQTEPEVWNSESQCAAVNKNNVPVYFEEFIADDVFNGSVDKEESLDANNQIAFYIARNIFELHKKGVSYDKITILDKSRTYRPQLCKWLEKFAIPYSLDVQTRIFSDAVVNDIYAFLKLCVDRNDLSAYGAYLCSPFAGLSVDEAANIFQASMETYTRKDGSVGSVISAFSRKLEENETSFSDPATKKKYEKARDFYFSMRKLFSNQKITETLNQLWYEAGYKYEVELDEVRSIFKSQYDILFELGRQCDENGLGLSWYVSQLEKIKAKEIAFSGSDGEALEMSADEIVCPVEKESAVNIMTIHKSKGLEFDYVYVMGCFGQVRSDSSKAYYYTDKYGLTQKFVSDANLFFDEVKEQFKAEADAEFCRLVYVAITRAVKEVHVVGPSIENTPMKDQKENWYKEVELDEDPADDQIFYSDGAPFKYVHIKPRTIAEMNGFTTVVNVDKLREEKIAQWNKVSPKTESPVNLGWCRISPSALEKENEIKPVALDKTNEAINKIINESISFGHNHFGNLAHKLMELYVNGISEQDYDWSDFTCGLDHEAFNELLSYCIKFRENFLKSKTGQKIQECMKQGNLIKAEWGFKTYMEEYFVTGSIDLIFETAPGKYMIVDYKTDQCINPEKYIRQQTIYKKAAVMLLNGYFGKNITEKDIDCCLFFMRFSEDESKAFTDITKETDVSLISKEDWFDASIE